MADVHPNSVTQFFRDMAERHREELRDRSEMYRQVGRVVVTLSEIEEYLAEIFVVFAAPISEERAAKMFYEVRNLEHKIKLVDYAVVHGADAKANAEWRSLQPRIGKQKAIRNTAAHASVQFKQEKESKKWRISIGTQARDTRSKKAGDLNIEDVQAAADELLQIEASLRKFLIGVIKSRGGR